MRTGHGFAGFAAAAALCLGGPALQHGDASAEDPSELVSRPADLAPGLHGPGGSGPVCQASNPQNLPSIAEIIGARASGGASSDSGALNGRGYNYGPRGSTIDPGLLQFEARLKR